MCVCVGGEGGWVEVPEGGGGGACAAWGVGSTWCETGRQGRGGGDRQVGRCFFLEPGLRFVFRRRRVLFLQAGDRNLFRAVPRFSVGLAHAHELVLSTKVPG